VTLTGSSDGVQYSKLECPCIKSFAKMVCGVLRGSSEGLRSGLTSADPGRSGPNSGRRRANSGRFRGTRGANSAAQAPGDTLLSVPDLVLVRHGQSDWNAENLFTGWVDRGLTERGRAEAQKAGRLLAEIGDLDLGVVHTSVLTRAVQTANLLLDELGRSYLPVRRHYRLNERHYGALQGLNKLETAERYGADQVKLWRRSYSVRPPLLDRSDPGHPSFDPRYKDVPAGELPSGECLEDVVTRIVPYWVDFIAPDLFAAGSAGVLVAAHGNSIRALRKHLEGISDEDIVDLEVPTGVPFRYRLADDLSIIDGENIGDADEIAAATEEVRRQAG
jgi:2,3-bisphosphoglycerate-dependent phosphoglycerate mutase